MFGARKLLMTGGPLELVGYSNSTTNGQQTTVVVPAVSGVRAGDLLVAVMGDHTSTTWTGDTGWSEILEDASGGNSVRLATKIATASEPGSYTFTTLSSVSVGAAQILAFRRAAYDSVGAIARANGNAAIAAPAITAPAGILIAAFYGQTSSGIPTFTTPSGMTATTPATNDPGTGVRSAMQCFYEEIQAGSTGTRTSTRSLSGGNGAGYLIGVKRA